MSKENNGGPAYPTQGYEGLTLRDYFAGQAMQGWLASYPESNQYPVATHHENMVAELSYLMADAMLKAREEV
ncbi:hypothetical protein VKY16_14185 [Klebsiella variicola]|uniref:hypothetical protein n=1 Tax=Klebsiella variicola TaxID=244366 RepID=UPI00122D76D8|nr:hypothetical protein [Klebsiella variicola]KAA1718407.1 hypothetical protein F1D85_02445 [Klebsiella variicola]MEB2937885.1 hypothetical protein [Klebsiella variicola]MEB2990444.1 hypothetical protein [Klebsiella variicola]